jgi:hypothetical protein
MPVELDQPLALAPADQHVEALHRHIEVQRLNPFDGHAQGVVVAQIVELGAVLALDGLDTQLLAPSIASVSAVLASPRPARAAAGQARRARWPSTDRKGKTSAAATS